MPFANLTRDARVLWQMCLHPHGGETHKDRLDSFYSGQAEAYDHFRQRLLHGRQEMIDAIATPANGVWVDLGAGTGENAERIGPRIGELSRLYLVDLCPSLLRIARDRIARQGWSNVQAVEADATQFRPAEGTADVVTFSYSLTMIPDWFRVLDQALSYLKPGGMIGVVDFYTARKHPEAGTARHGRMSRLFWPAWFASSNVFLNPDHLPYLQSRLETVDLFQGHGQVPYLPLLRAPYYRFLGRKPLPQDE